VARSSSERWRTQGTHARFGQRAEHKAICCRVVCEVDEESSSELMWRVIRGLRFALLVTRGPDGVFTPASFPSRRDLDLHLIAVRIEAVSFSDGMAVAAAPEA
jgi:hypothetical protein